MNEFEEITSTVMAARIASALSYLSGEARRAGLGALAEAMDQLGGDATAVAEGKVPPS